MNQLQAASDCTVNRADWTLASTDQVHEAFRYGMRRMAANVTIVTTQIDGRPWGVTVSAFTSICMDPPTVLVCLREGTAAAAEILAGGHFGINLLSSRQVQLSKKCALPGAPKFVDEHCVPVTDLPVSAVSPVLDGSLVSFDCSLVQSLIVGDHLMLLGRVDAVLAARTDQPLLYSEGRYHGCTELRAG